MPSNCNGESSEQEYIEELRAKTQEYLEELRAEAKEDVLFFSNANKPERERWVVREFLKCLGVTFTEDEIVVSPREPPDVIFRGAGFEVTEVLDEDRRRHDEYHNREKKCCQAGTIADVLEPYTPPDPMAMTELIRKIAEALSKKRYDRSAVAQIDALVYVNFQERFLKPDGVLPELTALKEQGWRSVCFLSPLYAEVVCATENAPEFLKGSQGRLLRVQSTECVDPTT